MAIHRLTCQHIGWSCSFSDPHFDTMRNDSQFRWRYKSLQSRFITENILQQRFRLGFIHAASSFVSFGSVHLFQLVQRHSTVIMKRKQYSIAIYSTFYGTLTMAKDMASKKQQRRSKTCHTQKKETTTHAQVRARTDIGT